MNIRDLNMLDIPGVVAFLPELYELNFPGFRADAGFLARKRLQLRDATRDHGQGVLVCEDNGRLVGFIWLVIEEEYSTGRRGEVAAIHVDRRRRGEGIGRRLLEEGEQLLRSRGCNRVYLMVTSDNEVATALYRDSGYLVTRYQMEKQLKTGTRI